MPDDIAPLPEGFTLDTPAVAAQSGPASTSEQSSAPLPEGFSLDTAADSSIKPPGYDRPSHPSNMATAFGQSYYDQLYAGAQGTSPSVKQLDLTRIAPEFAQRHGFVGTPNYELAPQEEQDFFAEAGFPRDQQQYVALRNPDTGHYAVYKRNQEMAESPLMELGRMIGFGSMVGTPTKLPGGFEAPGPTRAQNLISDFDRVGVEPNTAAIAQNPAVSTATNILSNIPIAGAPIVSGAKRTLAQTQETAENVASSLGDITTPRQAGQTVEKGIEDFAKGSAPSGMSADQIIAAPTRESGFMTKAGALYDRFRSFMDNDAQVPLDNTLASLRGPMDRFPTNPAIGQQITNPKLASWMRTLSPQTEEVPASFSTILDQYGNPFVSAAAKKLESGGTLTFGELSELRSTVGRMLGNPELVNDIPRADLARVYGGITQDLKNAAEQTSAEALSAFNRANNYYNAGRARVDQLDGLLGNDRSPEGIFSAVNRAAGSGSSADVGALNALKKSMDPDEFKAVGSSIIRQLGKPTPGATDPLSAASFSPSTYVTNWSKISNEAKDILFGTKGTDTRDALESLSRVAGSMKNVQKFANSSHSATQGEMVGLLVAMHEAPISTTAGLLGGNIMSRALMNPTFTKWLYRMPSVMANAQKTENPTASVAQYVGALQNVAKFNKDIAPAATAIKNAFAADSANNQAPVQSGAPAIGQQ